MQTLPKSHSRPLSILIIDDSTSERVQLRVMLLRLGHSVKEAATGLHALDIFTDKSQRFDLIFLDVCMPGIDGLETAHRIRTLEKKQSEEWCPIIFLSGRAAPDDIAKGIEAGGDDYLAKPVNAIIIKSRIAAMQRIADMRQRGVDQPLTRKERTPTHAHLSMYSHPTNPPGSHGPPWESIRRFTRTYGMHSHAEHGNEKKQQLDVLAHTDELTQLPNRRHFLATLNAELARAKRHNTPLAIAYMDLDHFKHINDTHGHETGDIVLRAVANVISTNLRIEDSIGRIGGEEFCICLPGADAAHSLKPCERYRSLIENLKIHTPSQTLQTLTVTASFGLTSILHDSDDSARLLARADAALYRAKQNGRNRVEVITR